MAVNTEGESEPLETLQPILAKNPFGKIMSIFCSPIIFMTTQARDL